MRIRFDHGCTEFKFADDDTSYDWSKLKPLAKRCRLATNICEFVYNLPGKGYIYLTVVGDEDQKTSFGITRGWYVVEKISEEYAKIDIESMKVIENRNKRK